MNDLATAEIQLEIVGPMTGDTFIAACLDAFPRFEEGVLDLIDAACESYPMDCRLEYFCRFDERGRRFLVESYTHYFGNVSAERTEEREPLSVLRRQLLAAALPSGVVRHVTAMLSLMQRDFCVRHDVAPGEVSFPKDEAWKILAQAVGAAVIIDNLGSARWTVSLSGSESSSVIGRAIVAHVVALPELAPIVQTPTSRSIMASGIGFPAGGSRHDNRYVRLICVGGLAEASFSRGVSHRHGSTPCMES